MAGVTLEVSPTEALRRLVTDGPVGIAIIDEPALAIYGGIAAEYPMDDGLVLACHQQCETDAIITKDDTFAGLETVEA